LPRVIDWAFRDGDAYPIHRVVITQGIVDISVANGQERTLLPAPVKVTAKLEDTQLHLVA
jgi:hypothetical protein